MKKETVTLRLVPVEVFGAEDGYGLCDAVSCWSDCNRAVGKIYRVDEDWSNREEGETVTITIDKSDLAFFDKKFGDYEEDKIISKKQND